MEHHPARSSMTWSLNNFWDYCCSKGTDATKGVFRSPARCIMQLTSLGFHVAKLGHGGFLALFKGMNSLFF